VSTTTAPIIDPIRAALEARAVEIDDLQYEHEAWLEGNWPPEEALPWINAGIWNAYAADFLGSNGYPITQLNMNALDDAWRRRWLNGDMAITTDDVRARFDVALTPA